LIGVCEKFEGFRVVLDSNFFCWVAWKLLKFLLKLNYSNNFFIAFTAFTP